MVDLLEPSSYSVSSCPHGTCKNDGCCDVYEQVFSESEDENAPPNTHPLYAICSRKLRGYARYKDTTWCTCTLQMCLDSCPNSFLCGSTELFKWYLACHDGRCCTCNIVIGRNLKLCDKNEEEECPICMNKGFTKACVFPDCPAEHAFCLKCTRNLLFGIEMRDEFGYPYYEGSTNSCPMCRHTFEPTDGWHSYRKILPFAEDL